MPSYSHTLEVNAPPPRVFAILDDVARTPEWLRRCTGIDKVDAGPNAVGTRLRYHYRQGGSGGQMDGRISAYEADAHIAMLYTDTMMDVGVDFSARPGPSEGTTSLTHTIDIGTHGLATLFWPIIKVTLPKQTTDAMNRLKDLAESEAR